MPNHPTVEILTQLARDDLAILHAKKQIQSFRQKKVKFGTMAEDAKRSEAAAELHSSQLKKLEIQLQQKFETYEKRKKTAIKALETGAGNAESAERQIRQCINIIDETETGLLQNMDDQESALLDTEKCKAAIRQLQKETELFDSEYQKLIDDLKDVIASKRASRKHRSSQLNHFYLTRYEQLRTSKGTAVARVVNDCCRTCQLALPVQDCSDIRRGREVSCKKCGRWLFVDYP